MAGITVKLINVRTNYEAKVPLGQSTVLGRGPLLKCTSSKVSRTHAEIIVSKDGEVTLKATSKTPVYFKRSSGSKQEALNTGDTTSLANGDIIAMTEDEWKYRLEINNSQSEKKEMPPPDAALDATQVLPDGNDVDEEEAATHTDTKPPVHDNVPNTTARREEEEPSVKPKHTPAPQKQKLEDHVGQSHHDDVQPVQRERTLPTWMIGGTQDVAASAGNKTVGRGRGRGRGTTSTHVDPGAVTQIKEGPSGRGRGRGRGRGSAATVRTGKSNDLDYDDQQASNDLEASTSRPMPRRAATKRNISYAEDFAEPSSESESEHIDDRAPFKRTPSKRKKESESDEDWRGDAGADSDSDWGSKKKAKAGSKSPTKRGRAGRPPSITKTARDRRSHSNHEDYSDDDDDDDDGEAYVPRPSKRRQTSKDQAPPASSPPPKTATKAPNPDKRTPCVHGKACYRKNPAHKKEYSHPGDSDYESEVVGAKNNSDLPECEYGSDCYRKNAQHLKEYKHTRPPKRDAAKKADSALEKEEDDDSQPNTYDYNDSFINDASATLVRSGGDEDYAPSEGDQSEEEEDLNDLKREANEFRANKKMQKPVK